MQGGSLVQKYLHNGSRPSGLCKHINNKAVPGNRWSTSGRHVQQEITPNCKRKSNLFKIIRFYVEHSFFTLNFFFSQNCIFISASSSFSTVSYYFEGVDSLIVYFAISLLSSLTIDRSRPVLSDRQTQQ